MSEVVQPDPNLVFARAEIRHIAQTLEVVGDYFVARGVRKYSKDPRMLKRYLSRARTRTGPDDGTYCPEVRAIAEGGVVLSSWDFEVGYTRSFIGPRSRAIVYFEGDRPAAGPLKGLPVRIITLEPASLSFSHLHIDAASPTLIFCRWYNGRPKFLDCTFGPNVELVFHDQDPITEWGVPATVSLVLLIVFSRAWAVALLKPFGLRANKNGADAIVTRLTRALIVKARCRALWDRFVITPCKWGFGLIDKSRSQRVKRGHENWSSQWVELSPTAQHQEVIFPNSR